jgi:uncharacterized membrane protein YphA (DoxX/SURF4 family)
MDYTVKNTSHSAATLALPAARRATAFDGLRTLLGAIWLLNAGFQTYAWLWPARSQANAALLHAYSSSISGAPGWLHPFLMLIVHSIQAAGPHSVALAMVIIDLVIALSLLTGRWVWWCSWLGIAYCLFCWTTLESLGYPYTQGQTDPGVFINYVLAFVFVLSAHAWAHARPGERPTDYDPFRTARILFGILWVVDAALKWQPYFLTHFTAQLTGALPGQPPWIAAYIHFVIGSVQAIGPLTVAVIVAIVETLLALSLLSGRGLRLALPLGALYCLAVWTTAEGWGGPYTSAGTGMRGNVFGNAIIYVIMFLYLWAAPALAPRRGTPRLT